MAENEQDRGAYHSEDRPGTVTAATSGRRFHVIPATACFLYRWHRDSHRICRPASHLSCSDYSGPRVPQTAFFSQAALRQKKPGGAGVDRESNRAQMCDGGLAASPRLLSALSRAVGTTAVGVSSYVGAHSLRDGPHLPGGADASFVLLRRGLSPGRPFHGCFYTGCTSEQCARHMTLHTFTCCCRSVNS